MAVKEGPINRDDYAFSHVPGYRGRMKCLKVGGVKRIGCNAAPIS